MRNDNKRSCMIKGSIHRSINGSILCNWMRGIMVLMMALGIFLAMPSMEVEAAGTQFYYKDTAGVVYHLYTNDNGSPNEVAGVNKVNLEENGNVITIPSHIVIDEQSTIYMDITCSDAAKIGDTEAYRGTYSITSVGVLTGEPTGASSDNKWSMVLPMSIESIGAGLFLEKGYLQAMSLS